MIIEEIKAFLIEVPRRPFSNARGATTKFRCVIVKIGTDENMIGFGETSPAFGSTLPAETIEEIVANIKNVLKPLLIGKDPLNILRIQQLMDSKLAGHSYAKDGIESALFDLLGKVLRVPVHILLGGKKVDRIPLVAPVGLKGIDDSVKDAHYWIEKGFVGVKVKIGLDPDEDAVRLRAIRRAIGDNIILRADANQGYSSNDAIRFLRRIEELNLQSVEQPVQKWNIEGMKMLSRNFDTPIMADESVRSPNDAANLIKYGAANLIKVKVQGQGGIRRATQTLSMCEASGILGVVGKISELSLGAAAEIHVASTSGGVLYPGEMIGPAIILDDIVKNPLDMSKGYVEVPDLPGLGFEIDEAKLNKYSIKI